LAGDDRFLEKAHKRMADIGASNIMVLASHSMPLPREWCNRGIFMEQGRLVVDGSIDEAICGLSDLLRCAASGLREAVSFQARIQVRRGRALDHGFQP
jgi:ABC-type phosphate/phosphonate transport system ATPase subunit